MMSSHSEEIRLERYKVGEYVSSEFTWEQICALPIDKLKETSEFECVENVMRLIAACSPSDINDQKLLSQPSAYRLTELLKFISQRCLEEIDILRKCYFELWQKSCRSHFTQTKSIMKKNDGNAEALNWVKENEELTHEQNVTFERSLYKPNAALNKHRQHQCNEQLTYTSSNEFKVLSSSVRQEGDSVISEEAKTRRVDRCSVPNSLEVEQTDNKRSTFINDMENSNHKKLLKDSCLTDHFARNAAAVNINPHMCSTLIMQLNDELEKYREMRKVFMHRNEQLETANSNLESRAQEREGVLQKLQHENYACKLELQKWKSKCEELQLYNKSLIAANDEQLEEFSNANNVELPNRSEPTNKTKVAQKIVTLRKREQILMQKLRSSREKCTLAEESAAHWAEIVNVTVKKMQELMASDMPNKNQMFFVNRHNAESLQHKTTEDEEKIHGVMEMELPASLPKSSIPTASVLLQHKVTSEMASSEEKIIKLLTLQFEEVAKRGMLISDMKFVLNMHNNWQEYFSACYAQMQLSKLKQRVKEKDAFIGTLITKVNLSQNKECKREQCEERVLNHEATSITEGESITSNVSIDKQQIALYVQRLNEKEAEVDLLETHLAENQEELQKYHNYMELMCKAHKESTIENTNLEELKNLTAAHLDIEFWVNKAECLERVNMELLQHLLDIQHNVKVLQIENDNKDKELEVLNININAKYTFALSDKASNDCSNKSEHEHSEIQKTLLRASLHEQTILQKRVAVLEKNAKKMQMELLASKLSYAKCRTTATTYHRSCYSVYKSYVKQVEELCQIARANRRRMEAGVGMHGAVMLRKHNNYLSNEITRLQKIVKELTIQLEFSGCITNSRIDNNSKEDFEKHKFSVSGKKLDEVELLDQVNCNYINGDNCSRENCKNSPLFNDNNNNGNNYHSITVNSTFQKVTYKELKRELLECHLDNEYAQSKIRRLESEIRDLSDELQKLESEKCFPDVTESTIVELKKLQKMMLRMQSCSVDKESIIIANKKENDVCRKSSCDSRGEYAPVHPSKATYVAEETFSGTNKLQDEVYHKIFNEERLLQLSSKELEEGDRILNNWTQQEQRRKYYDKKREAVLYEEEVEIQIQQLERKVACLSKQLANSQEAKIKLEEELNRAREQERQAYERLKDEENKSRVNVLKIAEMQKVRDEVANGAVRESTQALTKLLEQKNGIILRLETELSSTKRALARCEVEKASSMEETYERLNANNRIMFEKYSKDLRIIKEIEQGKHLVNERKWEQISNIEATSFTNTININKLNKEQSSSEINVHEMRVNSDSYESVAEQLHALTEKVIYLQKSLHEERQANVTLHNLLSQIETSLLSICKNCPCSLHDNRNCKEKQNNNGKLCLQGEMTDSIDDKPDKYKEPHTLSSQITQELTNVITAQEILLSGLRHQLSKRDEEIVHERKRGMLAEEQLRKVMEEKLQHSERRPCTKSFASLSLSPESTAQETFDSPAINSNKEIRKQNTRENNDGNIQKTDTSRKVQRLLQHEHQSLKQYCEEKEQELEQEERELLHHMMEVQKNMIVYLNTSLDDYRQINEDISNIITISEKVELAISLLRENAIQYPENTSVKNPEDTSNKYTAVMHRIDILMKNISNVANNIYARMTEMQKKTKEQKEKQICVFAIGNKDCSSNKLQTLVEHFTL